DRLECAALEHAARRLEVVEDRLEPREALEAHHLLREQRSVVPGHHVALPGQLAEALVERHAGRISPAGSRARWGRGRASPRSRTGPAASSSAADGVRSGTCKANGGPTFRFTGGSATCWSRRAGRSRTTSFPRPAGSRSRSARR